MVTWDEWTLDTPARRLIGRDGPVHLEPQVFDVLAHLVEHHDRVVPKEELLDEVWGDQFVSESALTTRIKSARRALGDDGRTQKYIRNVHGRGYQFVGMIGPATKPKSAAAMTLTYVQPPVEELELALSIALDDDFPFVGRSDELRRVDELLDRPDATLVLLGGEPGIGKSRLAVEALGRATERGAIVCAGRCEENVTYALQPIRDAVAQLASTRPADFRSWAAGVERQVVSLVPALVGQIDAEPQPVDGYSALEVLATVVERAAREGPTMLLIDDLHWSDEPTRAFISRIGRRLRDLPIGVVCTYRSTSTDLPAEVRRWIGEHTRLPSSLRLDIDGFDAAEVKELVTRVLGADQSDDIDHVAGDLLTQTGGNGLFLTESLRDLQLGESTGSSVNQMVRGRLERLPNAVQNLVRVGAVLGTEFSFEVSAAAAQLDPPTALASIDEAVAAELLHETASPSRFRFSHQLVPEAIRTEMSGPAAAVIHHRCAEALAASGADDAEIAHHLLGAVPLISADEAVGRSRAAATEATKHNQFDRAVRLLEQVLATDVDTRTRAEVLLQIGWAVVAAGRTQAAVPRFEEAAEIGRRNGWSDVLVDAALGHYGRSPYRRLLDTSTLDLLAEADAALGDEPSLAKARVLAKSAVFSQFSLPLSVCDDMTQQALDMVPDAAPLDRLELLESRGIVFSCPAGVAELDRLDPELEALREEYDIYFADAAAPETRLLMIGDGDGVRRVARFDEDRVKAQPIAEWRDLTLGATVAAFEGDLARARRRYDDAGAIGEQFWGDSAHVLHGLAQLFMGSLDGDWTPAREAFDLLLLFDDNQQLILSSAWAHLAAGNDERGRELAERIRVESYRWHCEHIIGGNALIAAAEVALLLDDDRLAAAAEEHLTSFADLMLGLPWAPALAGADSLARLAARRGDTSAARMYTERARQVYAQLGAPSLLARLH
jgi:DNA-binding winged helix-turn-helix (wHTH) protein/tetratricopeptide (TPR) repeat protein